MAPTLRGTIELCYLPFSIEDGLKEALAEPSASIQIIPDGRVKVAAPLPYVCADLKTQSLGEAWDAYREAWKDERIAAEAQKVVADPSLLARSNDWTWLDEKTALAA